VDAAVGWAITIGVFVLAIYGTVLLTVTVGRWTQRRQMTGAVQVLAVVVAVLVGFVGGWLPYLLFVWGRAGWRLMSHWSDASNALSHPSVRWEHQNGTYRAPASRRVSAL
jgi:hypothetical protein